MSTEDESKIVGLQKKKLHPLFEGVRVEWFTGSHTARGHVTAVYSDGTLDVESDTGNVFHGWPFLTVRLER